MTLEGTSTRQTDVQYPRCLAEKRRCPPEDVGGIYGYEDFRGAIGDPDREEHNSFIEWAGGFDAEAFDLDETNAMMRAGM